MNTIAKEVNAVVGHEALKVGSDPSLAVRMLPTGVLPIDVLLSGIPRGRMTEIFGNYSTLKSYVALRAIATTQASGGVCALVDTEHAYDPEWLEQLGGDPEKLNVSHPAFGEEAIEASEVLIRSGADLIVWDSIAATITKSSQEKRARDDIQPARLAAFMSRALPRLVAANTGTTAMLWINQTRSNIGVTFGPTEATPGGRAMPFYASYRIRFAKAGAIREDVQSWNGEKMITTKQTVGQKIRATLEKSKLNTPDREVWFDFNMKTGTVDDVGFLIGQGIEHGLIQLGTSGKQQTFLLPGDEKPKVGIKRFRASLIQEDIQWLHDEVVNLTNPTPRPMKVELKQPDSSSPTRSRGSRPPAKKTAVPRKRSS